MSIEKVETGINSIEFKNKLEQFNSLIKEKLINILQDELGNIKNFNLLIDFNNFIYTNFLFNFNFNKRKYFGKLNLLDRSIWYHINNFLQTGKITWSDESILIKSQYKNYKFLNEVGINTISFNDIYMIRKNILILPYLKGYSLDRIYNKHSISIDKIVIDLIYLLKKLENINKRYKLVYGDLKFDNLFFDKTKKEILLIDPQIKLGEYKYDVGKLSFNGLLLDYINKNTLLTKLIKSIYNSLNYNYRKVRWIGFEIYKNLLNQNYIIKSQETEYFLKFYNSLCKIKGKKK